MSDLLEALHAAVQVYLKGRAKDASEMGEKLLIASRATPHAATVYRHQAEFLLAMGDYDSARRTAEEAGNLARATQHPSEILSATLTILACDMYQGNISLVYKQLEQLQKLAPKHPMSLGAMARLQLLVGEFESSLELCEKTRSIMDDIKNLEAEPMLELAKAQLLQMEAEALLVLDRPDEAMKKLERVLDIELQTPLPHIRIRAMFGQALAMKGLEDEAIDHCAKAVSMAKKISIDLHAFALCKSGIMNISLNHLPQATDQLRAATALFVHSMDRQCAFFYLGQLALHRGMTREAKEALTRALEPSTETFYGRGAVKKLHQIVGLQVV